MKILEIDSERRRLSLSIKRVEGQVLPVRPITAPTDGDAGDLDNMPELGLSEDVFAGSDSDLGPCDGPDRDGPDRDGPDRDGSDRDGPDGDATLVDEGDAVASAEPVAESEVGSADEPAEAGPDA